MTIETTRKYADWESKEIKILIDTVVRHIAEGRTRQSAFQQVAKEIGRTVASCGAHWQNHLKNKPNVQKKLKEAEKKRKAVLRERHRIACKRYYHASKKSQKDASQNEKADQQQLVLEELVNAQKEAASSIETPQTEEVVALTDTTASLSIQDIYNYLTNLHTENTYLKQQLDAVQARLEQAENNQKPEDYDQIKEQLKEAQEEAKAARAAKERVLLEMADLQSEHEVLLSIINKARTAVLVENENPSPKSFKMDKNGNLEAVY